MSDGTDDVQGSHAGDGEGVEVGAGGSCGVGSGGGWRALIIMRCVLLLMLSVPHKDSSQYVLLTLSSLCANRCSEK